MVIEARLIRRPVRFHTCENCRKGIMGSHVAVYGMADRPEKPYWVRVHFDCVKYWKDSKVVEVLVAAAEAGELRAIAAYDFAVYREALRG